MVVHPSFNLVFEKKIEDFDDLKYGVMSNIISKNGEIKEYNIWRTEFRNVLTPILNYILVADILDIGKMNVGLDKLKKLEISLEKFVKDVKKWTDGGYSPHLFHIKSILAHPWPLEDVFAVCMESFNQRST